MGNSDVTLPKLVHVLFYQIYFAFRVSILALLESPQSLWVVSFLGPPLTYILSFGAPSPQVCHPSVSSVLVTYTLTRAIYKSSQLGVHGSRGSEACLLDTIILSFHHRVRERAGWFRD